MSEFFENLRKSSYKIENIGNLWKLWDFFYLLFLIRAGYKVALRGGSKNFLQVSVLLHDVKNMGFTPWYERNDSLTIKFKYHFHFVSINFRGPVCLSFNNSDAK